MKFDLIHDPRSPNCQDIFLGLLVILCAMGFCALLLPADYLRWCSYIGCFFAVLLPHWLAKLRWNSLSAEEQELVWQAYCKYQQALRDAEALIKRINDENSRK